MAELVYNVSEAAAALGISRPAMYNLIHQDGFPLLKVGYRRLIPKDLLVEWMHNQVNKEGESA